MEIPADIIAVVAKDYFVFAFDEGTSDEIRSARIKFNDAANDAYRDLTRSALMQGFHRPTATEFRESFITACRAHLRKTGMI